MTEAEFHRRWPDRHGAGADFDPQARWSKARPRADGTDDGTRPAGISTTPWSRRSRERSAGATCWRAAPTATIAEIAAAEKINESYVGRVLRLTLLAPDIVEAILNGRQPARLQLKELFKGFPVGWREQRAGISVPN